jgi:hypothetical protein
MRVEPGVIERKPLSDEEWLKVEEDRIGLSGSDERLERILWISSENGARNAARDDGGYDRDRGQVPLREA